MSDFLDIPDISQGHALPNLAHQDGLILRVSLGATKEDTEWRQRLAEMKREYPKLPLATYVFLTGPKRGVSVSEQMEFYAHRAPKDAGTFIDWETDSYTASSGQTVSFGSQPFSQVLAGVRILRALGRDPGVYTFKANMTEARVKALEALDVPVIWVAAFGGLTLDRYILDANAIVGHQYTGTGLDRSRFFTTDAQWRAWCKAPAIDPVHPPVIIQPDNGAAHVRKGAWWDYEVTGTKARGYSVHRSSRQTGGFSARYGSVIELQWGGKPRTLAKLTTGAYAGEWVDLNDAPSVTHEGNG